MTTCQYFDEIELLESTLITDSLNTFKNNLYKKWFGSLSVKAKNKQTTKYFYFNFHE